MSSPDDGVQYTANAAAILERCSEIAVKTKSEESKTLALHYPIIYLPKGLGSDSETLLPRRLARQIGPG